MQQPHKTPRRWFRFSLRTLFLLMTAASCSLGAWLARGYIPGTIRFSDHGFPQGTGTMRSYYPNGSIKVEEYYRNGLAIRQTWYRPDGSVFVVSEFDVKHGG